MGYSARRIDTIQRIGTVVGKEVRIVGIGRISLHVGVAVAVPAGCRPRNRDHLRLGRHASGNHPAEEFANGTVPRIDHGRNDRIALHVALHRNVLAHRSARSVRIGEQLGRHFIRRCRRINLEFGIGISQVRIENVARVVRGHTAVGRYALHVVCTQEITRRSVEQELVRTGRKHELVARRRQRIDLTAGIDDSEFVERYVLPNLRLAARTPAVFDLGRNLLAHGINPLGHAVMRRNRKFHALALVIGRIGGIGRDRGGGRKNHLRRHRRKVIDRNE